MRKAIALLALAVLVAAGCASSSEPIPEPPWLTPRSLPNERADEPIARPRDPSGNTQTIEAEGEGITAQAATKEALRNALERGAGVVIRNESLVVDWRLARDVVLSETQGNILKFDLLDVTKDAGLFKASVRAVVSTEMIAKDLSILHYLSNHQRIACAIADLDQDEPAETALAQSSFEKALLAMKFNVVDRAQVEAVKARDVLDSFDDPAAARRIGSRWGCDILITGKSSAEPAGRGEVYGVQQVFCSASIEAKAVLVTTGKVIASDNVTVRRGARDAAAAQALALSGAGDEIAETLITKVVLYLRESSVDELDIELLVKGLDFRRLVTLEGDLGRIKGMQKVVQRSYQDGIATLECRFRGDARTLALMLAGLPEPQLEVVSVEQNRIEVKARQEPE